MIAAERTHAPRLCNRSVRRFVAVLLAVLLAPCSTSAAHHRRDRIGAKEAVAKAHRVLPGLQLAAFADSHALVDCDRLSARRITCRYTLDFGGRIAPCNDRITMTTRWFRDGERYIGWTIRQGRVRLLGRSRPCDDR